ncbi:hypothetical protein KSP39_PZI012832 [Platanthera zijinensis]|uniref:Uncharacterized protein n=1 Tax=Platanthera zijinensis TaxID=2320716 RepID=A0AAP0BFP0_9ASPA
MKKRKPANEELLEILELHLDEQHQELEFADVEQNLHVDVEYDVNLLLDNSEDLVPKEEELNNLEVDRHEKVFLKRLMQTNDLPRQLRCLPRLAKELFPENLLKSITAMVKDELTQDILSTVLINLQRVIPNLDSDSILVGLVTGIQSPGDAISGSGIRNCFSNQQKNILATWMIRAFLANDLYTDESFVYSKAAGKIKDVIYNLPPATVDDDTERI